MERSGPETLRAVTLSAASFSGAVVVWASIVWAIERGIYLSLAASPGSSVAMVALHQGGQRVQKRFRTVQRIYVQFRFVLATLVVRVKHHGGHTQVMPFRTNLPALQDRHRVRNHNRANVAGPQDFECCFNRGHWYDPVSGVRQNGVADGGQHPFRGDRKDCWTHRFLSRRRFFTWLLKYCPRAKRKQVKKGLIFV